MNLIHGNAQRIRSSILEKYSRVATRALGEFRYPTGEAGLQGLNYDTAWYAHLPRPVRECFCGVGNHFSMGLPEPGSRVLDVGCGCGVDSLIAAHLVGPDGFAVGVEFSPGMAAKARENALASGTANAAFARGTAEALPFADESFDELRSSGVYNLVMDKEQALREALRVLRPGGRLLVADQALTGLPPQTEADAVASWFR
ncbi:Ubiquinone/menaquinone biosynthesis C-methyltransferase UbiE [Fundidesulfovibrio magnetotacticus]|uniref:Ubiquinone/menaquinone biosynthesis C-methyltransferase UbiE n=1 Tax=Fundidesulfovibrio magnetotacticus TaxID=2730080 RepID=A0A6V8LS93_9BACT|nr:methyltransferase domain-containing protein [Fundidesulfovibrio magnetotacticus]GFK95342.1 Ubiquinone/menaquinone biosynthesis C-methyltransferase UbiE [Fundidesulfovibrio magnetotacticus]